MIPLAPLGDRAFLARFETEDQATAWAEAVRGRGVLGVVDVVAAYRTVGVVLDPEIGEPHDIEPLLRQIVPAGEATAGEARTIELPVLYEGEDLAEVARRLGLGIAEVIERHAEPLYRVFAVGFLPGFPYAGPLLESLSGLPRRPSPRDRVPAGSVAIAGSQTGVYPIGSPGGWHLLGRTPLRIADMEAGHFPIRAGDRLRFVPIGRGEFDRLAGRDLS